MSVGSRHDAAPAAVHWGLISVCKWQLFLGLSLLEAPTRPPALADGSLLCAGSVNPHDTLRGQCRESSPARAHPRPREVPWLVCLMLVPQLGASRKQGESGLENARVRVGRTQGRVVTVPGPPLPLFAGQWPLRFGVLAGLEGRSGRRGPCEGEGQTWPCEPLLFPLSIRSLKARPVQAWGGHRAGCPATGPGLGSGRLGTRG